MSRDVRRAARTEIKTRADRVERSLAQIQVTLRRAERKIEADARERIRKLRKEAKKQLAAARSHEREARRILGRLSTAAEDSWGDIKKAADRAITDALAVAHSMRERFRRAIGTAS
jgi:hypothetical protein